MSTYFAKKKCPECGQWQDPALPVCPHCGHREERFHDFDHQFVLPFPIQLVFLGITVVGLQVLGLIVGVILMIAYVAGHPGADYAQIMAAISEPWAAFTENAVAYCLLAGAFVLVVGLRKKLPALFKTFAQWKSLLAGVIGFGVLYGVTFLYGLAMEGIFTAAGMPIPGPNENEILIRQICLQFPVWSVLVFGLVGPFVEEMGYRVGMFGFLSRVRKPLAYILTAFVFGFAHFGWSVMLEGDTNRMIVELVNIPTYVGAGAILCFLYDRFGFSAAYTAHALNNVLSIVLTLSGAQ